MSGVAATLLHGETAHRALGLMKTSAKFTQDDLDEWADARLVIIDESSFAHAGDFEKIQRHLHLLMGGGFNKPYGGLNVIFAGDYSQLEPVEKTPIYLVDEFPEFHGMVNTIIELDSKWRFMDDPVWGERLLWFRQGVPTSEDIHAINNSCSLSNRPKPPKGIQVATHRNRDRDAINSSIFEEFCRKSAPKDGSVLDSAVLVFMDNLEMTNSVASHVPVKSNAVKKHFCEHCSEDDLKMVNCMEGRLGSVLKLYSHCPLMLTRNSNVGNGEANGGRVVCQCIKLKVDEDAFPLELKCGTTVLGVHASQVDSIVVKHVVDDIAPSAFEVKPVSGKFAVDLKIRYESKKVKMAGQQFPLVSNSCTTGHKLQGSTCKSLLVNTFHYGQNWCCVVPSRVKTMSGLCLREKLSTDLSLHAVPQQMVQMLEKLRSRCGLSTMSDEGHSELSRETDLCNDN